MNVKFKDTKRIWTDPEDAPELDDTFFARAELRDGTKIIKRGRPVSENPKTRISIRYSPEVLTAFKSSGAGWQTRMDAALKDWLKQHDPSKMKM